MKYKINLLVASMVGTLGFFLNATTVARQAEFDVELFQRFQATATGQFRLDGAAEGNGFVQTGGLIVVLEEVSAPGEDMTPGGETEPADPPVPPGSLVASELTGNWFQIDLMWFPLWVGVAESDSGEFFAIGLQWNSRIAGRAYVMGDLTVEMGRYGFRGQQSAVPQESPPVEQRSAAAAGG